MLKELAQQFRTTLITYLKSPNVTENKQKLAQASQAIYDDAIKKYGLEPDNYFQHIDTIIKSAVNGIKIHPNLAYTVRSFIRQLSWSDEVKDNQAFHALNMALEMYLCNNLINPEPVALKKLVAIEQSIQNLKTGTNPYTKEIESAYVKLKAIVDQYFALSPDEQIKEYVNFMQKLTLVCSKHKKAIESDAQIKSVFYSFLATIFSFFQVMGNSISTSFQRKSNFFQDAPITLQNVLRQSDFIAPLIEFQDMEDEQQNNGTNTPGPI